MVKKRGRPKGSRKLPDQFGLVLSLSVDRIKYLKSCRARGACQFLADVGYRGLVGGDYSLPIVAQEITRSGYPPMATGSGVRIAQASIHSNWRTLYNYYCEVQSRIVDFDAPISPTDEFPADAIPRHLYKRMLGQLIPVESDNECKGWAVGWRPTLKIA